MVRLAAKWKTPVVLIVAMLAVWLASAQLSVQSLPAAHTDAASPVAIPDAEPPSNEIADSPQLD